jgi:hypothetical protein
VLLFLHLSVSTSCYDSCLFYVARLLLVFTRGCNLFSAFYNVIDDVSCNAFVGYKSREVFISFCCFCTAYRAAQTVTTILHNMSS